LKRPGLYERVSGLAEKLVGGLKAALAEAMIPAQVNSHGSLATVFFTDKPVRNYEDAKASNTKRYARYFREMLDRGVFLAPSQFEAAFVSAAHTEKDIERTIAAARESLQLISADSAA
jgi:glutamate-1-semialdehyde 2,1-aminomutase